MWTCNKCGRIFEKAKQPHSCNKIPLENHFENKEKAKEIFNALFRQINKKIGKCKIISIPCCIHLFGNYDFLAALPKKDRLEIRFVLGRKIDSPRLKQTAPLSSKNLINCIDLVSVKEINFELIKWLEEAYHLKDK
ncbi:hypothetical protein A2Z22_04720 [Candidatus Woesebacteria bacterium RBG_16_34_12]|uniref:DUF5655 domain-containing protein n=1 Tax=Candidatus Woesebacteria bacterium RBG_16_34_12 TaxID=1802480 RepID=A0A1F7XAB6_9BACT|nr:MAG: hypothetical protein A2Z22_04720 [Candidatus Woesebacteria bacterium RBG_16_34_12]